MTQDSLVNMRFCFCRQKKRSLIAEKQHNVYTSRMACRSQLRCKRGMTLLMKSVQLLANEYNVFVGESKEIRAMLYIFTERSRSRDTYPYNLR